ncbi:hypothetical protein AABB24_010800, partial [Solanum stoloniferum]
LLFLFNNERCFPIPEKFLLFQKKCLQFPPSPCLFRPLPSRSAMNRRKTTISDGFQHHLNLHHLTTSPPSPGVLHPHAPSLFRPIKFGHKLPENNNIQRYLALCLLHYPFSDEKRHLMPPIPYPNGLKI